MLKNFYVVTMTSIYQVTYNENTGPGAEKIALKNTAKTSKAPLGYKFNAGNGALISVGKHLISFIPEGGGITSFEREVGLVNIGYWLSNSSEIVALFFTKEEATLCLQENDLKPCDERWIQQTKEVLESIDNNHPGFSVSHEERTRLVNL